MKLKFALLTVVGLVLLSSCEEKLDKKYKTLAEGVYADIQLDEGDILLSLEFEENTSNSSKFCFTF